MSALISAELSQPATLQSATPVLPAADLKASLAWWIDVCGFSLAFQHNGYAGLTRNGVTLHLAAMQDQPLALIVGAQTMLRFSVDNVTAFHHEFQQRGGIDHPNGTLHTTAWGTTEFAAIDPTGVCVTFSQ